MTQQLSSGKQRSLTIGGLVGHHQAGDEGGDVSLQLGGGDRVLLELSGLIEHHPHGGVWINGADVERAARQLGGGHDSRVWRVTEVALGAYLDPLPPPEDRHCHHRSGKIRVRPTRRWKSA